MVFRGPLTIKGGSPKELRLPFQNNFYYEGDGSNVEVFIYSSNPLNALETPYRYSFIYYYPSGATTPAISRYHSAGGTHTGDLASTNSTLSAGGGYAMSTI